MPVYSDANTKPFYDVFVGVDAKPVDQQRTLFKQMYNRLFSAKMTGGGKTESILEVIKWLIGVDITAAHLYKLQRSYDKLDKTVAHEVLKSFKVIFEFLKRKKLDIDLKVLLEQTSVEQHPAVRSKVKEFEDYLKDDKQKTDVVVYDFVLFLTDHVLTQLTEGSNMLIASFVVSLHFAFKKRLNERFGEPTLNHVTSCMHLVAEPNKVDAVQTQPQISTIFAEPILKEAAAVHKKRFNKAKIEKLVKYSAKYPSSTRALLGFLLEFLLVFLLVLALVSVALLSLLSLLSLQYSNVIR
jgi:hypothetical protein